MIHEDYLIWNTMIFLGVLKISDASESEFFTYLIFLVYIQTIMQANRVKMIGQTMNNPLLRDSDSIGNTTSKNDEGRLIGQ